jgi:acetone carboxylase gamma subunit
VVKNAKIFQSGLIVMDDLPWWKVKRVFKVVKNAEIFQSGLAVMGDLPR